MRSARTLSRSDTGPPLAQYRAYFTTGVTVSQGSFTKWSKKFFPYFRDFLANKKEKGLQAALEALFFVLDVCLLERYEARFRSVTRLLLRNWVYIRTTRHRSSQLSNGFVFDLTFLFSLPVLSFW